MSFLSRLFGRSSGDSKAGGTAPATPHTVTAEIEHEGFTIRAAPYKNNGQFQTAGLIEKEVGDVRRVHRFVRADRTTSIEEATQLALSKGRLIVDQQGEAMFE